MVRDKQTIRRPIGSTRSTGTYRRQIAAAIALVAVLGLSLAACQPERASRTGAGESSSVRPGATQTNEGGQVTVAVTWAGAQVGPTFEVALDTHSVDLDGYDLRQLAVLRTSDGREARPASWDAPKGNHHRSGPLTFPSVTADGSPLIGPVTKSIELIVRDVAGVPERRFTWTL